MATIRAQRQIHRGNKHAPNLTQEANAIAGRVRNAPAPSRIKCNRCNIVKNSSSFSKNQLATLATCMSQNLSINPTVAKVISCTLCTGGQVVELTCDMCDKTMGLNKFPKSARRTPDKALCWTCSNEKNNMEPGARDSDDDDSENSRSDYDDDDDSDDQLDLQSSMAGVHLSRDTSSAATYRSGPRSTSASGGVQVGGSSASTLMSSSTGCYRSSRSAASSSKWAKPPKGGKSQQHTKVADGERSPEVSDDDDSDDGVDTLYSFL